MPRRATLLTALPASEDFWKGVYEPMGLSEKNRARSDADGCIFVLTRRLKGNPV